MGRSYLPFLACLAACIAAPAQARAVQVEEWTEVEQAAPAITSSGAAERLVSGVPLEELAGVATYGPFRVTDGSHAALVGITDAHSPAQFAAMLHDYPQIATLDLVECPGTFDDIANLRLGRMIRDAGIATRVPRGGSVRSGAVELFLAGASREIDDGARFAVHAWEDDTGRQASDYPPTAPENAKYLDFYRAMGMDADRAKAFYAMTNSVPFERARWLDAAEMRGWVANETAAAVSGADAAPADPAPAIVPEPAPRLAFLALDLDLAGTVH